MNRQKLQDAYINQIIDEMEIDKALLLLFMYINKDLDRYSDNKLIAEVNHFYPQLVQAA
jgi:hypothetical protein